MCTKEIDYNYNYAEGFKKNTKTHDKSGIEQELKIVYEHRFSDDNIEC